MITRSNELTIDTNLICNSVCKYYIKAGNQESKQLLIG